jgi:biopolymer transport protein ExbD
MIDVLFLLLIFFMTASVFREAETQLAVNLQPAETAEAGNQGAGTVVVTITEENRLVWGQQPVSESQLRDRLAQVHELAPDSTVVVRGDRGSDFGLGVMVMDLARQAGFVDVAVAAARPEQ